MDLKELARDSFRLIETGDPALAEAIIDADFVNHEADDDPDEPARQQRGPAGFLATSLWLRQAFADLHFGEEEIVAETATVIAASTMTGRHIGTFQGLEPTGRVIHQKQVHIFHTSRGRITTHRAVRDDLGLLLQLGWRPSQR